MLRRPLASGQEVFVLVMPQLYDNDSDLEAPPAPPDPTPDPPGAGPMRDPAAEIFRIVGKWIWDLGTPL